MTYYNAPRHVDDAATPVLIPTAVGFMSIALWIAVFVFLVPWDQVPAPIVCEQIPIYKGFWGTINGYREHCAPSNTYTGWAAVAAVVWSIGATAIAILATIHTFTRRHRSHLE